MVNRKRSVIERGAIIMVYHYTDGFLTVLKENALKAWMNHEEYQNKCWKKRIHSVTGENNLI